MQFDSLLFPEQGDAVEMFWHGDAESVCVQDGMLCVSAAAEVSFDSYYGIFPLKVYREFTVCVRPVLHVTVQGTGILTLTGCSAAGEITEQEKLSFSGENLMELTLQLPEGKGDVLYWGLIASAPCRIAGAFYQANAPAQREVCLAAGICTFRREEFVSRNAARISELFGSLHGGHHLYIADNGQTLDDTLGALGDVSVLRNPNTGGSGGFTRTICAALSEGRFTHMLLMDDDISFRPEVIRRTLHFLSLCREEHRNVTVGGTMCLLGEPWKQFEAGAKFLPGGVLSGLHMGLDLRDRAQCIANAAAAQEADYNSWWYCCMPMDLIRQKGLPMPFFIKMDDVEYALRLGTKTVSLPGVCVAHESFEKKYNPALDYYIIRNTLVTCAMHDEAVSGKTAARQLCGNVIRRTLLQQYECAGLVLRAYRDFLKGPVFFIQTDPAECNSALLKCTPKMHPAADTVLQELPHVSGAAALAGLLLPCRKQHAVVHGVSARVSDAYRTKTLTHFHPLSGLACDTHLQRGRAIGLILRAGFLALRMLFGYGAVKRAYQTESGTLYSLQKWEATNAMHEAE